MFPCKTSLGLPSSPFITAAGITPDALTVAWCAFDQQHWHAELHHRWQLPLPVSLQTAVTKRKAEYLASRWLAQQTLTQLGMPDFVLRNAPDRSPVWPAAVQGSLSHTRSQVLLAVTREAMCVGVDIERHMAEETACETADMLMQPAERALLKRLPLPFAQAATLLFSLKESVYKALWPQLHQPMDFLQAELTAIDIAQGSATLHLCQDFALGFNRATALHARIWLDETHVMTLLTHPLPPK